MGIATVRSAVRHGQPRASADWSWMDADQSWTAISCSSAAGTYNRRDGARVKLASTVTLRVEGSEEGEIAIKPTDRLDKGTDGDDTSETQRQPVYMRTDHVLWRTGAMHADATDSDSLRVEVCVDEYASAMDVRLSDHKSVLARLGVRLARMDRQETIGEVQRR